MINLNMYQKMYYINEKSCHKVENILATHLATPSSYLEKLKTHESIRKTHSKESGKKF